jgi:hypothetical protein
MIFFGANTVLNDDNEVNLTVAEEQGTDKISEFFKSKLPWDMTLPILDVWKQSERKKLLGTQL